MTDREGAVLLHFLQCAFQILCLCRRKYAGEQKGRRNDLDCVPHYASFDDDEVVRRSVRTDWVCCSGRMKPSPMPTATTRAPTATVDCAAASGSPSREPGVVLRLLRHVGWLKSRAVNDAGYSRTHPSVLRWAKHGDRANSAPSLS
jgi:hypothetical protein